MFNKEDLKDQLYAQYEDLQQITNAFIEGDAKATDVKHQSALLGIYKERNDTFMHRLRMTAGIVTPQYMRDIADVMDQVGIEHGHLSTRQNIQLHGVPLAKIEESLKSFYERGIYTRGGGGNTFRNVITSSYSGVSSTEVFDTTPYVNSVWDYVYGYQKAYEFGRKLKVGFTSEPADDTDAGIQDLGFIPQIVDGKKGFKVYGGGGMGRGGSLGILLFDFLPADKVIEATIAIIDLFHEHGDRENRSKARLRFILERLGEEGFKELYMSYFNKADIPDEAKLIEELDYAGFTSKVKVFDNEAPESIDYANWVQRTVRETKFEDVVAVRVFARKGNFDSKAFRALANLVDELGSPFIRITLEQDAVIPFVHKSTLPYLYKALLEKLPDQASTSESFVQHVISCIGAERCPIGVLKAPAAAEAVAEALDEFFADKRELKNELYTMLVDSIHISGCPSSCGRNQSSPLGFNGMKKKVDGVLTDFYQIHVGASIAEVRSHLLAKTDPTWIVNAQDIGKFVVNVIAQFVDAYKAGTVATLREFTISLRDKFKVEDYV